jgi:hypothetical protein
MYQRARKLQEARVEMSQLLEMADMQREALVTALNAMALLDEKNAWFVLPSAPSTSQVTIITILVLCSVADYLVTFPRNY